jgi:(1->4)-alpha-D-glucan 1-alpha-D-glucosylmutase
LRPGWINSLAQKLLTITGPGVPDLYQGSELWDLSLVDPDNRRPVDFSLRRQLLTELDDPDQDDPGDVWATEDGTGRSKLLLVSRALRLRRDHPDWFGPGATYQPLDVEGPASKHTVAFGRTGGAVTIVPRLPITLERDGGWRDTAVVLPPGRFRSALTDKPQSHTWEGLVNLADVLAGFPAALLRADAS